MINKLKDEIENTIDFMNHKDHFVKLFMKEEVGKGSEFYRKEVYGFISKAMKLGFKAGQDAQRKKDLDEIDKNITELVYSGSEIYLPQIRLIKEWLKKKLEDKQA